MGYQYEAIYRKKRKSIVSPGFVVSLCKGGMGVREVRKAPDHVVVDLVLNTKGHFGVYPQDTEYCECPAHGKLA